MTHHIKAILWKQMLDTLKNIDSICYVSGYDGYYGKYN